MSKEHPFILYIGDHEQGRALQQAVEARQWWVDISDDVDEALGLYVTDHPDITVIDAATAMGSEAYHHLRMVSDRPILVLTEDPRWDYAAPDTVYTMVPPQDADELTLFVVDLLAAGENLALWA